MAPDVRQREAQEISGAYGMSTEEALLRYVELSESAWTWLVDGFPACMFGVIEDEFVGGWARPWFMSTPVVERESRQFARACKSLLPELKARFPMMEGVVGSDYTLSVRWLEWLGAKIGPPSAYGTAGDMFRPFKIGG
jgi:hypothetical protein